MNASWHHNYASLGWWSSPAGEASRPHYPSIAPEVVELGVHPLLAFLARLHLERMK